MALMDLAVELLNTHRVKISWTGTDGYPAWIFRNGLLVEGPIWFDEIARSFELEASGPVCLEVHEAPEDEPCQSVFNNIVQRPTLWWSPRDASEKYLVYRTPAPGEDEAVVKVLADDGGSHYEFRPALDIRDLDGEAIWSFYRVEASNARGVESVRDVFPVFVPNLPLIPDDLEITGAAGVFDLELQL